MVGDLWLVVDMLFPVTGSKSACRHFYLRQARLSWQRGPDTLGLQTDIRLSARGEWNLVKMSDDLGQSVTPAIIFRSAGSTLLNDIKHRPSCLGSHPKPSDKQCSCLMMVFLYLYLYFVISFTFYNQVYEIMSEIKNFFFIADPCKRLRIAHLNESSRKCLRLKMAVKFKQVFFFVPAFIRCIMLLCRCQSWFGD